jgi:5-methylcytosine-specific restriction protein A
MITFAGGVLFFLLLISQISSLVSEFESFNINEYMEQVKTDFELDGEYERVAEDAFREGISRLLYEDYGIDKLRIALQVYMDSISYYEGSHNNRLLKTEREIYDKHSQILDKNYSAKTIEDEINEEYWEGKLSQVNINIRERNRTARNKCIESKGKKCAVCEFDFEKFYGELGKDFIHVHHVNPISNREKEYKIDNIEDELIPVCPNCHAMLHRRREVISIEELKQIIENNKREK